MKWGVDLHFLNGSVEERIKRVKGVLASTNNIKLYV
jgi:hypothetical protein